MESFNTYFGKSFINSGRFSSYGLQLQEIINLRPESVLDIGIGNGITSYLLRKVGVNTTTLDCNYDLKPDIIASVSRLPFKNFSFDIAACFEVLEHIPWDNFLDTCFEIARVVKKYALISIPDRDWAVSVSFDLPKIGQKHFAMFIKRRLKRKLKFRGEHYWEIGRNQVTLQHVIETFQRSGFDIESTYRNPNFLCHRFFRLKKV